jgi:hypothetical protein
MPKKQTVRDKMWKVPKKGKNGEWYPVVRVGRHIPFGYEQDPDDSDILLPIPEQLEALEKGKQFIYNGYSLRQVAQWLTDETGRYISHVGLKKRFEIESKRRKAEAQQRFYAKRAAEAYEKAKRIEGRIGGSGTRVAHEDDSDSTGET